MPPKLAKSETNPESVCQPPIPMSLAPASPSAFSVCRSPARRWLALAPLLLLALAGGCQKTAEAPPVGIDHAFELQLGEHRLQAWLAVEPAEQQRGLMYRESLPANTGMLFVFRVPDQRSFWMRNTPLALDIGYFAADGTLRSLHPLYPHDERAVASATADIQFALEMERGWFAARGIRPGQRLDLAGVAAGLKARGFEPGRYLLEAAP